MSVTPVLQDDAMRRLSGRSGVVSGNLRIDCDDCVMRATSACDDCVVSFIVKREPGDAVVVDVEEERALRALGDRGLVPRLRHRTRAG
jgi:hypothetical protein